MEIPEILETLLKFSSVLEYGFGVVLSRKCGEILCRNCFSPVFGLQNILDIFLPTSLFLFVC